MSDTKTTDANEHASEEVPEFMDQNEENSMLSSQAEVTTHDEFVCGFEPFQSAEIFKSCLVRLVSSLLQEEAIRKKYGGMLPKKPPLISKDHERAYFDSADWALGKQGAPGGKPKGPLEALRPKLQPTPHQQVRSRRSIYTSSDADDGGNAAPEEANSGE